MCDAAKVAAVHAIVCVVRVPLTYPPYCACARGAGSLRFLSEEIAVVINRITHPYTLSNNALRTSLDDPLLQKRAGRRAGRCRSTECWSVLN